MILNDLSISSLSNQLHNTVKPSKSIVNHVLIQSSVTFSIFLFTFMFYFGYLYFSTARPDPCRLPGRPGFPLLGAPWVVFSLH